MIDQYVVTSPKNIEFQKYHLNPIGMKKRSFIIMLFSMLFFEFAADINVCGQLNLVKAIREGNIEKANEIADKSNADDFNQIVKIKMPSGSIDITCSLGEAVRIKDSVLVKRILAKGANPNQVIFISPYYFTPLMKAAENNDLASAKYLIEYGANVNYQLDKQGKEYLLGFEIGKTALHFAAEKNSAEVAELLIKSGANVNIQNAVGKTPLMMAAKSYTPKMLQKEGALLNKAYYFSEIGKTIPNYRDSFLLATRNYNAICILLNNKAHINLQDTAGNTALHYAILKLDQYNDTRTAIHQLLSYYPNVNLTNSKGDTPLLLALRTDLGFESDLMIYLKANIAARNKAGEGVFASLLESYRTNQFNRSDENLQLFVDNIKGLFKLGAKDDRSELLIWLSLIYFEGFMKYDLHELVRLSLDSGSDPNFSYGEKYRSVIDNFINAYQEDTRDQGCYFILKMLFEHGATNIRNKESILLKMIQDGDERLISLLILNKKQYTPIQLQKGRDEARSRLSYLTTDNLNEKNVASKIEKTNKIIEMLEKAVAESIHE